MTKNIDTPQLAWEILLAYPQGFFPMSQSADTKAYNWYHAEYRGIIPIGQFHVSRSLRRWIRQHQDRISFHFNRDFALVMENCAQRQNTWISQPIQEGFGALHSAGLAHSLSVDIDDKTIGGIYGLAMGRAFFGESMYSQSKNGSKLALYALLIMIEESGYELFDTQYITPHLRSLGGQEIHAHEYQMQLNHALRDIPLDQDLLRASGRNIHSAAERLRRTIGTINNPDIISRMIHSR